MKDPLNQALDALVDEMEEVLNLGGSARCILRGAVVEHLSPHIDQLRTRIAELEAEVKEAFDSGYSCGANNAMH